jgi:hypothetical protein
MVNQFSRTLFAVIRGPQPAAGEPIRDKEKTVNYKLSTLTLSCEGLALR